MKEILAKIMQPTAAPTIAATVVRRLAPGRYELRDDLGRLLQADSSVDYAPESSVLVQSGRIVSRSGNRSTIRIYEV